MIVYNIFMKFNFILLIHLINDPNVGLTSRTNLILNQKFYSFDRRFDFEILTFNVNKFKISTSFKIK